VTRCYLLAIPSRIFPESSALLFRLRPLELSLAVLVVDELVVVGRRWPQVGVLVVARVATLERLDRSERGVEGLVLCVGI